MSANPSTDDIEAPPSLASFDIAAAETDDGTEIQALTGLKRFILHTDALIHKDWDHFFEEAASDIPAFVLSGMAVAEIAAQDSFLGALSIGEDNIGNFGSAACASLLMFGLYQQKEIKRDELKEALELYTTYNDDCSEHGHAQARKNLEASMLLSGLQFSDVPEETRDPKLKQHYVDLAASYGIFPASMAAQDKFHKRADNVRAFLRQPLRDMGLQAVHVVDKKLEGTALTASKPFRYVGHLSGNIVQNICLFPKILGVDTPRGIYDSVALSFSEVKHSREVKKAIDAAQNGQLRSEHFRAFSMRAANALGEGITEEQRDEIRNILVNLRVLRNQARSTRRFLALQLGYMGFQGFQSYKNFKIGHTHEASVNLLSVGAALGPLSGFSRQLRRQLQRIDSHKSFEAEKIAHIINLALNDNDEGQAAEATSALS